MYCDIFYDEFASKWKELVREYDIYREHSIFYTKCYDNEGIFAVNLETGYGLWEFHGHPHSIGVVCRGEYCEIEADIVTPLDVTEFVRELIEEIPQCRVEEIHPYPAVNDVHPKCLVRIGDVERILKDFLEIAADIDKPEVEAIREYLEEVE